ncbi:MAG: polyprenyl synthetase family protein [Flavipsychrobacter sp.]
MHGFKELVKLFEERLLSVESLQKSPHNLYEPCRYLLGLGGKRVRPVLCLMGNELFSDIKEGAWHAAIGVELFHNFTLVHDDIMDEAPLRRGKETIHHKYGMTAGILSGDILCILAYEQLGYIKEALAQVLPLFTQTAAEVCDGQQMDMDFEQRSDVTIEEYLNMIALKTSVLLACSLKMGAYISGANEEEAQKVYEFGKNLGIAFQLQDDYLDAYGDPEKNGKQVGGDIKANKKTYLLLKAIENANPEQRIEIEELLASTGDDKVEKMLSLYDSCNAKQAAKDEMLKYSNLAFDNLATINVAEERKAPLRSLAEYLLQREK